MHDAINNFLGAALVIIVLAWTVTDSFHRWGGGAALGTLLMAAAGLVAMAGHLGPPELGALVVLLVVGCVSVWWWWLRRRRKPAPKPPSE